MVDNSILIEKSQDSTLKTSRENSIKEISQVLAKLQDKDLINDFFYCLLTPKEVEAISSRWQIVKEIQAGTTQREIAKKFGLSLCNITRGSKELKKQDSALIKVLDIFNQKLEQGNC